MVLRIYEQMKITELDSISNSFLKILALNEFLRAMVPHLHAILSTWKLLRRKASAIFELVGKYHRNIKIEKIKQVCNGKYRKIL